MIRRICSFAAFTLLLAPLTPGAAQHRIPSAMTLVPRGHADAPQPIVFQVAQPPRPSGAQVVAGYMSAVAIGFLSWRALDEPDGQHEKVRQDWGYTPKAHKAFVIGSFAGATGAVWALGKRRGATGKLFSTAIGAAIPSIPLYFVDHPLLPFMMAWAGSPAQAIGAYVGYKATAR